MTGGCACSVCRDPEALNDTECNIEAIGTATLAFQAVGLAVIAVSVVLAGSLAACVASMEWLWGEWGQESVRP